MARRAAQFATKAEATARAIHLNRTKYKRSRISVRVMRLSPWWVLVGCSKAEATVA
mgnify:FL=1